MFNYGIHHIPPMVYINKMGDDRHHERRYMPKYINTTSNINKGNIKLYNYQQEVKNKTGVKTTIGNWSRGLGKTYTLSSIILDERPNYVLYVGKTSDGIRNLHQHFNEIFESNQSDIKNLIKSLNVMKDKIIIQYFDGIRTEIFDYAYLPIGSNENTLFDYLMFDDLLPIHIKYKCKRIISMVTVNNYNKKLEQLYKHNTIILNEDYSAGIKNGLFKLSQIEKSRELNTWYDNYAILDDPKLISKNTDKPTGNIILNTLFNEINCLVPKITKARENEDFGTYKNLILAYKEVLLLINNTYQQYGLKNEKVNMYINYIVSPNKNKVEVLIRDKHYMIWGNAYKKIEDFINPIKQIAENENATIYIDVNGCGMALYDLLSEIDGLIVKQLRFDNSYISGIF